MPPLFVGLARSRMQSLDRGREEQEQEAERAEREIRMEALRKSMDTPDAWQTYEGEDGPYQVNPRDGQSRRVVGPDGKPLLRKPQVVAPRNIDPLSPEGIRAAVDRARQTAQFKGGSGGVDRDKRSRGRSYEKRVNTLKGKYNTMYNAAIGDVAKRRVQAEYHDARANAASEYEDVAPETDANPNTRRASQQTATQGKGEAPDDVIDAAVAQFGGDAAKATAYLRSQGYN